MSHLSPRYYSLALFSCLIIYNPVKAQDIDRWPTQKQINTDIFEKHFSAIFSNIPDNIQQLYPALIKCNIDEKKAGELSNASIETFEAPYKNMPNIDADIDLDIEEINTRSTSKGCIDLQTIELRHISNNSTSYYQVPPSFNAPLVIESRYQVHQIMTMKFGDTENVTETDMQVYQMIAHPLPSQLIHSDYPQEVYTVLKIQLNGTETESYSLAFNQIADITTSETNKTNKITLSRSNSNGVFSNSINIQNKNGQGQDKLSHYSNDTLMTTVDGKLHGLMISKNYLYATDNSLSPENRSCYNMGEKIDVFEVVSDTECVTASIDRIDEKNVYMDPIYKIQRDLKTQLADNSKNVMLGKKFNTAALRNTSAQAKKKKQNSRFTQLISESKCKLKSNNWVYTGDSCIKGFADGEGSAEDRLGLKFIGTFESGYRKKGEIQQGGKMIFSGELVDDKPSGDAICLFEQEYEECRFFRGKRIDTLYKIRKENAKNIARMEQTQKTQRVTSRKAKGTTDYAIDAIEKEGMKRAASFIFDQLF